MAFHRYYNRGHGDHQLAVLSAKVWMKFFYSILSNKKIIEKNHLNKPWPEKGYWWATPRQTQSCWTGLLEGPLEGAVGTQTNQAHLNSNHLQNLLQWKCLQISSFKLKRRRIRVINYAKLYKTELFSAVAFCWFIRIEPKSQVSFQPDFSTLAPLLYYSYLIYIDYIGSKRLFSKLSGRICYIGWWWIQQLNPSRSLVLPIYDFVIILVGVILPEAILL